MVTDRLSELIGRFTSLVDILRWRALHQPNRRAFTFLVDGEGEGVHVTYSQLDSQARSIGWQLQSRRAVGERVLLFYPSGLEYIAAFFGCLYGGAVAVPMYPPRLNRSQERLQAIVADAQATVILTTAQIASRLEPILAAALHGRPLYSLATDELDDYGVEQWQEPVIDSDTLAFLQYTSGSTASPKGAMVSHGNLMHNQLLIKTACQHTEQSTFVSWLPIFHDMGLIGNVLQPLYLGALGVLMSPTSFLQRPFCWLQAVSKYKANTSGGPNFAFDLCVRKIKPEQRKKLDLSSWRVAFNGSEVVRYDTMERFSQSFESCGYRPETFYPCYGLAEATLFVSGGVIGARPRVMIVDGPALERHRVIPASIEDRSIRRLVSCGTAWLGQKVVIVDPNKLTPCPPDVVGEIWVSGPSVVQGYWNRAGETERMLRAYLATTGEGPYLRTGDLGFIDDGEVFVTGRLKDLIIIRGNNHYPEDIEQTAGESHPGLKVGCGVAFSVEVDTEERLVVVHELERSYKDWTVEEMAGAIRQAVSDRHELQVYAVALVEPGNIPKTSSGKLQRYLCREAFLNDRLNVVGRSILPTMDEQAGDVAGNPESFIRSAILALETKKERKALLRFHLQQHVSQLLRLSPSRLELHQPLTRLGLDSLIATELQSHLELQFGVILPISRLLQGITIDQLAEQVLDESEIPCAFSTPCAAPIWENGRDFPLSYGQRALWFLYQLSPESPAYNIICTARILGDLQIPLLRRAFQHLVDRHAALRTTFSAPDGDPVQRAHERMDVFFREVDASIWSEKLLNQRLLEEAHASFDLEHGPLLRVSLFIQSSREHVILLVVHHIVADFLSLTVLMRELGKLYDAEKASRPFSLDPLPLQYSDYVRWQAEMLAGPEGARLQAYWQEQLAGQRPVLNLPTDRPRPLVQTYRGASQPFTLSLELSRGLKALSRHHDATVYMTLLAAFQALMYRYTGQEVIYVGSPMAGRNLAALAPLVGYFVNPVVLRGDLTKNPTYETFLDQVRLTVLGAFERQDFPFPLLVDCLRPERDPSRSPVFQAMFVFHHVQIDDQQNLAGFALGQAGIRLKLGELCLESLALERQIAQFDLTLMMADLEGGLAASIQYNTDLFDPSAISRMAGHFQTLLETIVAHPQERVSRLPLLTEMERQQLILEWNATQVRYLRQECLHRLIEEQVESAPDAVAVAYGEAMVTYRELNCRANQVAHDLRNAGAGPDARVSVCLERSLEMVVALLGVLKAGAAYVPIDPDYPQERLSFLLEDAQSPVLLTKARGSSRIPSLRAQIICLDSDWNRIAQQSARNPDGRVALDNLAYVIYTSGSTGRPKGVMIPHRGICNRLLWMQDMYQLTESDRVLQKTSFSFDVSIWEFFWPLMTGACLVLAQPGSHKDVDELIKLIVQQQITTIHFVPSLLQVFLQSKEASSCSCLQRVLCSGESLTPHLQDRFAGRFEAGLHNLYGPTEASIDVTFWSCDQQREPRIVPIGRPIANTQIYLLDEHSHPAPVGAPGEIHIGGINLARGYLDRPDLTAEKFIPDPFSQTPGARLFKTADLARYLANGEIEFLGRLDYQVKIRGFRIEPREVELSLMAHPGIRESVVIAAGDANGGRRLVAYCVFKERPLPTTAQLRAFLKERLPDYLIPSTFMPLEFFPLTSSGKIDRKALPLTSGARPELESPLVRPRTAAELLLAQIWEEVLDVEHLGVHDNFYELGGDSILSLQIISKANQAGFRLSAKHLLQYQTIAELATVMAPVAAIQAEQGVVTGLVPLTPIQEQFFEQRTEDPEHYNQALLLRLRQPLDATLLKRAVQRLLLHHDALRLRFRRKESGWQQLNGDFDEASPFIQVDLSTESESKQRSAIEMAAAELQASLNLSEGPLLRVAHFHLGSSEPDHLLIIIHHLVIDGVSWRILLEDLQTAIIQLSSCGAVTLPSKTTSYKCWAERLVDYAQSATLHRELPYWLLQHRDAESRLPVDSPQGLNSVASEQTVSVSLGVEETRSLLQKVLRDTGARVEEVLLTALARSLGPWTAAETVMIDLEGHGREEIIEDLNLSRTVGWFTTVYPILLTVHGAIAEAGAVKSISEQLRRIPNRGIGYGLLCYLSADLGTREKLQSMPQSEINFNFLGQIDQLFPDSSLFMLSPGRSGPARSPRAARRYLLEIIVMIVHGRLKVDWIYSENIHRRATVQRLAQDFIIALHSLISGDETAGTSPCPGPEDLLTSLQQPDADRSRAGEDGVEDIYPVSPMQKSLLLYGLYAQKRQVYIEQLVCTLQGSLDIPAFTQSWQRVVDQYPILRTSFAWESLEEPLQIVHRSVVLPLVQQDWRSLSPVEQQERSATFLRSDRERGFELDVAPLLRLSMIRLAEDTYQFIFSFHHLLMDGWSLSLILQRAFAGYDALSRGERLILPHHRPFKDYITWLLGHDLSEAEAYWRQSLKGFALPTVLAVDQNQDLSSGQEPTYDQRQIRLSAADTVALRSLARRHHLTLGTLVQAAWALLLVRYSDSQDVVFGSTVSGRNTGVAGFESEVGLFINTLPLRVRVSPDEMLLTLLGNLQTKQAELHQHEYSPLAEIRKWSEVPPDLPLFETQLIFQNYPVKLSLRQEYGNVRIQHVDFVVSRTNFALSLMAFPEAELRFLLVYDGRRFTGPVVFEILQHLCALLRGLAENPYQSISSLLSHALGSKQYACRSEESSASQTTPGNDENSWDKMASCSTFSEEKSELSDQLEARFRLAERLRSVISLPAASGSAPEEAWGHPRSVIVKTLAEIFADVLQVDQVGLSENFFALGGDSFRALQTMVRVQEVFQVELPPQALSDAPTIKGLAHTILMEQAESLKDGDDLLADLERLSEEEAVRLLADVEGRHGIEQDVGALSSKIHSGG